MRRILFILLVLIIVLSPSINIHASVVEKLSPKQIQLTLYLDTILKNQQRILSKLDSLSERLNRVGRWF